MNVLLDSHQMLAGHPAAGSSNPGPVPFSFAQQRVWDRLAAQAGAVPNVTGLFQLTGPLDADGLKAALHHVVRHHACLCPSFSDGPRAHPIRPREAAPPDFTAEELGGSAREQFAAARTFALRQARLPFDINQPPLVRAQLLRSGDTDHHLILSAHPLVCDGASLVLLTRQLFAVYGRPFAGRKPSGSGARSPHETNGHSGRPAADLAAGLAHWRSQLTDAPVPLALPSDRPRAAGGARQLDEYAFAFPVELADRLRECGAAVGGTLEDVFLAAFQVMLQCYAGQDEFAIGVTARESGHADADSRVGRFACFLPLRARPDAAGSFLRLVHDAARAVRANARHADGSFDAVLREAPPRPAPFSVAFAFRRGWFRPLSAGGLTVTPLAVDGDFPLCDLALEVRKDAGRLGARLVYDAGLLDVPAVAAMGDHFGDLLDNLAERPDEPLRQVPLLGPAASRRILHDWNQTGVPFDSTWLLHEPFEAFASRHPEAIALVHRDRETSYGELDCRASGLAARLNVLGVGPEVPVAVCTEPSAEMFVGLLGVLKAGGAYVPIDPATPEERLRFLIEDTRAPVILAQRHLTRTWPALPARVVLLDEPTDDQLVGPRPAVSPDRPAYIIYTSGSTGAPKGVVVSHRAICNTLHWRQSAFPLGPGDRVLQSFSFTFDASVWELFAPLRAGARLVIADAGVARDSTRLVELIARHDVTAMQTIPSRLGLLLDERGLGEARGLRHVICGGEPLTGALQERFFARLPGAALHNLYGPTETALDATFWTCRPGDGRAAVPIGRPIANKRVYLLDRHLRPVPVGAPGELYIGGAGLADGYLNNPRLTEERFLADPFAPEPGARVYRSGDVCRWTPEGALVFLGRGDEQVKVRGFRIERGEVEAAMLRDPAVRQAVVVARSNGPGDSRLVGYVVPAGAARPAPADVRRALRGRLPDYMVPSSIVVLDELPRTVNGKVDLRALPAPEIATGRPVSAPPADPVERLLAGLWEDVLGVTGVAGDDDFFDLGGTSIQVAVLIHKLQDRLGEYVYTIALYDAPTLAGLANYLRANYSSVVVRLFGPEALGGLERQERPVDEERVAEARRLLKTLPPRPAGAGGKTKNPRAAFVLSPPRSGSTLFRVLLGGHPQLFAPPELQLLNFDTLAERRAAFDTERDRFWLDGTVRAIMEARRCGADEAARIMADCERRGLTVKEFYGLVQGWLGGALFADKTPTYALDPGTLRRAEEDFDEPLYIHLIRHPSPVISSFDEAKLHVFFPPFFRAPHPFGVNELAELVWVISHRNILEFLAGVPERRRHAVRFEDLVKRPEEVMAGVAGFLGVPFHPAMTDPFRQDHKSRMTDGVHPMARMLGDVKFHEHKGIEAQAAERKKGRFPEEKLGRPTREMARLLGYAIREPEAAPAAAPQRVGPRCLVRLQAGAEGRRPLFCVHPAGGTASCYNELARRLGNDQPVYAFQAPGLAGDRVGLVRLEALAARYLEEMRAVQPGGPYQIAGWSVGGVISFEMTRQLGAAGQDVSLLALFDSDIPRQTERMRRIDPELVLAELAKPYGLDTRAGGLAGEARLQSILDQARRAKLLPEEFTTLQLRRLFRHHARVFRANVRAVRRYRPAPLGRAMVLFRPEDRSLTAVTGPKRDWADVADGVTTCTVPGDHFSMMREPHVAAVAEQLRDLLAGVDRPSVVPSTQG
jgi:amino acid adenylation domain-containing protein